jgi:hypothetical protein
VICRVRLRKRPKQLDSVSRVHGVGGGGRASPLRVRASAREDAGFAPERRAPEGRLRSYDHAMGVECRPSRARVRGRRRPRARAGPPASGAASNAVVRTGWPISVGFDPHTDRELGQSGTLHRQIAKLHEASLVERGAIQALASWTCSSLRNQRRPYRPRIAVPSSVRSSTAGRESGSSATTSARFSAFGDQADYAVKPAWLSHF